MLWEGPLCEQEASRCVRIVHVISNLGVGGAETTLYRLLANLAPVHGSHTVVSMLSGGAYAPMLRDLGVDVIELGSRRSASAVGMLPRFCRTLLRLQPDLVQAWMYHANIAASIARVLRVSRAPLVWNVRQTLERFADDRPLTRGFALAGAPLRSTPDCIVYNSIRAAEQHERLGYPAAKRCIILNGIDCSRFAPREGARIELRRSLGLADDALLVGRIARNAAMKDYPTLFRAFQMIAARIHRAHLVVVGPGMVASDHDLARLAQATGAPSRIHFLGQRLDVAHLMPGFDVVVSPSRSSEGFPNVVAEAMACGVAVMGTSVGETAEIIGDAERIVKPGDHSALARVVIDLLSLGHEARSALGMRDRARIEAGFALGVMADRYAQLWHALCAR